MTARLSLQLCYLTTLSFSFRISASGLKSLSISQPAMAVAAVRSSILRHLRVAVAAPSTTSQISSGFIVSKRGFSDEVKGSFLDKGEVTDRIITVVKNFQKIEPSKVTPCAHFQKDLGLDSLDTVEIVMALEEEFGFEIPDNEADKIDSIQVAVDFIASHPQAK